MEATHFARGTKRRHSGEQTTSADSRNTHGDTAALDTAALGGGTMPHADSNSDKLALTYKRGKPGSHGEDYFLNLYSTEPDFRRLGLKYPELGVWLKDGVYLDFTDPIAVVQLTKTLLREDFDIHVDLPSDRLCPPVPNRHNYILWLKELLDGTSSSYSERYEPGRPVTGLDIGTGASLIYPLLGCVQRPAWHFIATDIDTESLASARANARLNGLESRIRVVDRVPSDLLIPLHDLDIDQLDFVMVNPPFYSSRAEMLDLAAQKSRSPHSVCTGAPVEMVCEGGEVQFVDRMIKESLVLKDKVQWYTAMLGKQSSLEALVDVLRKHQIHNYSVTTLVQGSKTRRWVLGWSFLTRRPSLSASRGTSSSIAKKLLPSVTSIIIHEPFSLAHTDTIARLRSIICTTMESLDLRSWIWDNDSLRGIGFSERNVWSRAYRRSKAAEGVVPRPEASALPSDITLCAFGFSLSIQPADRDGSGDGPATVIRWLQGEDASLFESFAGMMRRCLRKDTSLTS
ncbi:hypothetical protein F4777DRAFT_494642 [Nemania sp. FL0916]|nr:hypothetical protein F4777DRAFT_494642 [Nemania sp. FL0916]